MIRGVNCPLATWMATRREPNVNTMKDRERVTIVPRIVCAPAEPQGHRNSETILDWIQSSTRIVMTYRTSAKNGASHSEDLT